MTNMENAQYLLQEASRLADSGLDEQAIKIYEKLSKEDVPEALVALSSFYREGRTLTQNTSKADELLQQAVAMGSDWALYFYSNKLAEDGEASSAFELLRELSERDYLPAMNRLARCLWYGLGCPADPIESLVWRRRAARRNHVWALRFLGAYLIRGSEGIAKVPTGFGMLIKAFVIGVKISGSGTSDERLIE